MKDNLIRAIGLPVPVASNIVVPTTSNPTIEHIGWQLGFGVGVDLPEAFKTPTSQPQRVIFTFGASHVVMGNVTPDVLLKKPIATLLLSLYALVTILCLHFPARVLGGAGRFHEVARLALNYYAYVILFSSLLAVFAATLLINFFALTGISVFIGWGVLVLAPFAVVLIRGFFATFSEYYGFSKKRLFLVGFSSGIMSSLLGPLFLVPCLYLLLWSAPLLEVVL